MCAIIIELLMIISPLDMIISKKTERFIFESLRLEKKVTRSKAQCTGYIH